MGCGQEKKDNYYAEYLGCYQHDPVTYSFDFKCDEISRWREGDHSLLIVTHDDILVGKKLSYASLPDEGKIRFTTRIPKEASDFKQGLVNLVKGEYVKISQPSGDFKLKREGRPVVVLSNGVGIAGIRGLVRTFIKDSKHITEMLQINVDKTSSIYKEEFDLYQKEVEAFRSYYLDHRQGYYGMVYHELKMMLKRHDLPPIFYLSGSDEFVEENRTYLMDLDFPEEDILLGGKQKDSCCRD